MMYLKISLLCTLFVLSFSCTPAKESERAKTESAATAVTVDQVFSKPGEYMKETRMRGRVVSVDSSTSTIMLGCADACIQIPVKYHSCVVGVGNELTVVGKVVKVENGFLFRAEKVEAE